MESEATVQSESVLIGPAVTVQSQMIRCLSPTLPQRNERTQNQMRRPPDSSK